MIRSLLRRRLYTPVTQLDALATLAASADADAQRRQGNQTADRGQRDEGRATFPPR